MHEYAQAHRHAVRQTFVVPDGVDAGPTDAVRLELFVVDSLPVYRHGHACRHACRHAFGDDSFVASSIRFELFGSDHRGMQTRVECIAGSTKRWSAWTCGLQTRVDEYGHVHGHYGMYDVRGWSVLFKNLQVLQRPPFARDKSIVWR